jgi:hypothetical protein
LRLSGVLAIIAMCLATVAGVSARSLPIPLEVVSFINLFHVCSSESTYSKKWRDLNCRKLEPVETMLMNRYRDRPNLLAIIRHPETVHVVGYVGEEHQR